MAEDTEVEGQAAPVIELIEGPKGNFIRLIDIGDETFIIMDWGMEGTGKTLWALRYMPLPIMVLNLDRPINKGHLGALPRERAEQIFVTNMRESLDDINMYEAASIKDGIERAIQQNLKWLKGGTVIIDGGTMLRQVLKLADPKLDAAKQAGKRFNPKDKDQVNAWQASLISSINDQGINLVITAHASNSWVMKSQMGDDGTTRNQLTRTNNVYPKFDDIGFERSNLSLLFFKRCECGRNITNQDGTCVNLENPFEDRPAMVAKAADHWGRKHMTRIVNNKFNTSSEGTEWEDLDMSTLKILCFEPAKATKLIELNR